MSLGVHIDPVIRATSEWLAALRPRFQAWSTDQRFSEVGLQVDPVDPLGLSAILHRHTRPRLRVHINNTDWTIDEQIEPNDDHHPKRVEDPTALLLELVEVSRDIEASLGGRGGPLTERPTRFAGLVVHLRFDHPPPTVTSILPENTDRVSATAAIRGRVQLKSDSDEQRRLHYVVTSYESGCIASAGM